MSKKILKQKNKGFTLLEIIITISIIIIVSSISMQIYYNLRDKHLIETDADSIISMIEKAKSLSLNRKNDSSYGVAFSSSTVTVFSGNTHVSGNDISKYDLGSILNLSLSSHGSELNFSKLTNLPNATGTITLNKNSYSKVITIYGTGVVEEK